MTARLQVLLFQARNLAAKDANGLSDPFVRMQLGKTKAKSATVYKNLNPVWNEEFVFRVDDVDKDVLEVSLWDEDFLGKADFLGKLSIPIAEVAAREGQGLHRTWYSLAQKAQKTRHFISGEVELALSLLSAAPCSPSAISERMGSTSMGNTTVAESPVTVPLAEAVRGSLSGSEEDGEAGDTLSLLSSEDDVTPKAAAGFIAPLGAGNTFSKAATSANLTALRVFNSIRQTVGKKNSGTVAPAAEGMGVMNAMGSIAGGMIRNASISVGNACNSTATAAIAAFDSASSVESDGSAPAGGGKLLPATWFDTSHKDTESKGELPGPLEGGVVLDQAFACAAHELNAVLFRPESEFWQEFSSVRKLTQVEMGPWIDDSELGGAIRRTVTYMTAPSSLVKSVRATEEVKYARADSAGYVVEVVAATPDVPYGTCFETHLQICITALKEGGCHLRISYKPNFLQSTMMKSMIENGMRSGIKDTYVVYLQTLTKYAAPAGGAAVEAAPETAEEAPQRAQKTVTERVGALIVPVCFAIFALSLLILPWHFWSLRDTEGLKLWPILELPDSIPELVTTAVLTLAAAKSIRHIKLYVSTMLYSKGDAGKKATGEGWVLSITLVEGEGIGGPGIRDEADPFVVFTCGGKTRTSSVKLKARKPKWNEVFEFDAFDDIPSSIEVELFDYEGPFAEADLLGRAEVDLLRRKPGDLGDMCLELEGRKARLYGTRLRLQVQVTQTTDAKDRMSNLVEKIHREAGCKSGATSAEKTQAFQKLFDLPEHEYLVHDFSCAIKKSILHQGRLFLSPRRLAFHSNLFGKKTKVTILWEDIVELRENSPSMNSLNRLLNPSITLFIRKGKGGPDAGAAAYGVDHLGRPKIRFQSFVRSAVAFRTIQLLWAHRALPPDQQELRAKEAQAAGDLPRSDSNNNPIGVPHPEEDNAVYTGSEAPEVLATDVSDVPVTVEQFLFIVREKNLMQKVSEALGQLNLEATDWVPADNGHARNVKYLLSKKESPFGSQVSVVQRTSTGTKDKKPWAELEEAITLHNVPFGDHFQVNLKRYVVQKTNRSSVVTLTVAITWLKETPTDTKDTIKKDVSAYYKHQFQIGRGVMVREIVSAAQ